MCAERNTSRSPAGQDVSHTSERCPHQAQKRVPLPEGLDMNAPLNERAVRKVFEEDDDLNKCSSIEAVSFTGIQFYKEDKADINIEGLGGDGRSERKLGFHLLGFHCVIYSTERLPTTLLPPPPLVRLWSRGVNLNLHALVFIQLTP